MLKASWEPVAVTADGNCLFRSISRALTGNEDDYALLKLAVIVHGCTNEAFYRKNVCV